MEDKSYEVDKMLNTLIEMAGDEVNKAKQRGYFGKDFVESVAKVIELYQDKTKSESGMGGYGAYDRRYREGYGAHEGYGNDRGGYDTHEGYGNYGTGEYDRNRSQKGERYGRSGERYG